MKKLSIIGSTGSIGLQALDVVRLHRDIKITALAAHSSVSKLEAQIREFKPDIASLWSEDAALDLKVRVKDTGCKVLYGMEGLIEVASYRAGDIGIASSDSGIISDDMSSGKAENVGISSCNHCSIESSGSYNIESSDDILLSAVVGMIGIEPAIAAIKSGRTLALANKESLVCAGHIIMPLAKQYNVDILPVDSEHSAIFQCLSGEHSNISRIMLTASGGPFRGYTKKQLETVQLSDALKHPNWSMGKKISIDSATMVNKGLEVMEACHLFGVAPDKIDVLIQPSSVVHSMVEFEDGAVMAQLGAADMKLPIQYALYYPYRRYSDINRLDFYKISTISFEKPDMEVFEGLALAYKAACEGGSMPTVFNAANEYAVERFLNNKIRFNDISGIIKEAMRKHKKIINPSLNDIIDIKKEVEDYLENLI